MKTRIRSSEEQFAIYRQEAGAFIFVASLAVGCAVVGAILFYLSNGSLPPLVFGSLFVLASVLVSLGLPKYLRTIRSDRGAVLLKADRTGLSVAPALNTTPVNYSWADVSRILLAKRLTTSEIGEKGFCWNQVIIYFRRASARKSDVSLVRRSRDQLWMSPKGHNISVIDFPKGEVSRVRDELARFFSSCDVRVYGEVVFDYAENTERFQP